MKNLREAPTKRPHMLDTNVYGFFVFLNGYTSSFNQMQEFMNSDIITSYEDFSMSVPCSGQSVRDIKMMEKTFIDKCRKVFREHYEKYVNEAEKEG